ncbi:Tat protein [Pseudovibrio japonicus]|uniref:Tat protein n=1 Tax=Pseudovibrio japonicus TaxID=366534 RepID=A0ABQ3E1Y3_9HYPH|nr:TIGR03808 family TAT-translocated repetitive protein [Pseudovibrio japonicus]GHB19906.1 Tat protein [Pseudovibrio japonicus]
MSNDQEILSRRALLGAGVAAGAGTLIASQDAQAAPTTPVIVEFPAPQSQRDVSVALQAAMNRAAENGHILQLGAGTYSCSDLSLPSGLTLHGVPGHTRLLLDGDGPLLKGSGADRVCLSQIIFDGGHLPLAEDVSALLWLSRCEQLALTSCEITGSAKSGLVLEQCSGVIASNHMHELQDIAVLSYNATALRIEGNIVSDCGDGGILVYRWSEGADGTIITGNRVSRIAAQSGGTGQNGNGINVFRADNVTISNNKVSDCTFSAIRANAASNVQILGNTCHRSGEVALFVEFGFQGAIVSNNLIETAANGISITNFNDGGRLAVCSNNVLRDITGTGPYAQDNPTFGVGISVEADTSVTGNIVEDARVTGINLGWGPYMRNLIAAQNSVRSVPVGIAVSFAADEATALISQNIISGCTVNIAGFRWDEQVSGDLALSAEDVPRSIRVADNLVSAV